MQETVFHFAVIGYVLATGLALAHLIQRHELTHRLASLATMAAWAAHTVALVVRAVEVGGPPVGSLPEAVSVAVWFIVLLEMLAERQYGVRVLGAFVMPIAVLLSLKATAVRPESLGPALGSAWIWVHVALALVGIAAFVLNFAGAVMYLLQERQLKGRRPAGTFYYRLPDLETLDRLTYRMLALGFAFLTTGLILGAMRAGTDWGRVFTFDPLAFFSLVMWVIYAGTLTGRAVNGWHGRRAAYCAIAGFVALVMTLGAGFFLPGSHGM
jgi:cytochrome c-type biogenesis protein CcsB